MPSDYDHLSTALCHLAACALVGSLASLAGCTTPPRSPYAPIAANERSPLRAEELMLEALQHIDSEPEQAESLLRRALAYDIMNARAHNNLGVLLLNREEYYEAALEFEWARKLMPGHPDPRLNLALTLERAGRIDEAIVGYESALEVYPEHMPTMQALAKCRLRHNRPDEIIGHLLEQIGLAGETAEWRSWARTQLALLEGG